jgi:hypothetical protein
MADGPVKRKKRMPITIEFDYVTPDPMEDGYDVPFCSECGSEMETDLSLDRQATLWCCPVCAPRLE